MEILSLEGSTEKLYRFLMVAQRLPRESFMLHAEAIEEAMEGKLRFLDVRPAGNTGKQWQPIRFKLACRGWYVEKETGQCGDVSMKTTAVDVEIELLRHLAFLALNDDIQVRQVTQFLGADVQFTEQFKQLP